MNSTAEGQNLRGVEEPRSEPSQGVDDDARRARRRVWAAAIGIVACVAASVGFLLAQLPPPAKPADSGSGLVFLLVVLEFPIVGLFILARQPRNRVGWILMLIGFAWIQPLEEFGKFALSRGIPGGAIAAALGGGTWAPPIVLMGTVLLLRFPDGAPLSPRWRKVEWFAIATMLLIVASIALFPGDLGALGYPAIQNPLTVGVVSSAAKAILPVALLCLPVAIILSASSLVMRFRRSHGEQRLQMKWLTSTAALVAVFYLIGMIISIGNVFGRQQVPWVSVLDAISFFSWVLIPIAIGFAVLRYKLWEIDVVIRKTVVFGLLVAFMAVVYVAVVGGIGALVGSTSNTLLSFVAAAVLAIAFQPVRDRARHLADRLIYGKRATPYEVLAEFSDRMSGTYSTDDALPRMAEILRAGTGADAATVWLRIGDELRPAAATERERSGSLRVRGDTLPTITAEHVVEVRHQGELLGALSLRMPAADPMNPSKDKLIQDLASQAGLVLRNVKLIEDLRASRQRLVAAQDQERRKVERNIHDGAQQQLVALSVKLRLADAMVDRDAVKARETLGQLQAELSDALENLRDLARGIYPPLLADQGLTPALQAQAGKSPVPVRVEPDGIDRYAPEIEATVYFCALEALQNVAKYAEASSATVRLRSDHGTLRFDVTDDGRGFEVTSTGYGTGLQGMADRLDAVGGSLRVESSEGVGTTVTGIVPIGHEDR